MATVIHDPELAERLIAERQQKGLDVYDEVREGVYVMAPWPNDEHQKFSLRFAHALVELIELPGLREDGSRLSLVATATPGNSGVECRVVPLRVALRQSKDRPEFCIEHTLSERKWTF